LNPEPYEATREEKPEDDNDGGKKEKKVGSCFRPTAMRKKKKRKRRPLPTKLASWRKREGRTGIKRGEKGGRGKVSRFGNTRTKEKERFGGWRPARGKGNGYWKGGRKKKKERGLPSLRREKKEEADAQEISTKGKKLTSNGEKERKRCTWVRKREKRKGSPTCNPREGE